MTSAADVLPAGLLSAAASRSGRVVLVLGAGCSFESPTDLELSGTYSVAAHTALLRDGLIDDGDCDDPSDLSALASALYSKHGGQSVLVERLPLADFRNAQANDGYRIAAALLREESVSTVATLNFDLAMSDALRWAQATEVSELPAPDATKHFGSRSVIYLHRNVEELDYERWILRVEALEVEWRDEWEEMIANRVMASPVVVFAGLGSPAAVLTETAKKIAAASPEVESHVVDPAAFSTFAERLGLDPTGHIRRGWCDFMGALGSRVHAEICDLLASACVSICQENQWSDEVSGVPALRDRLEALGLLDAGTLRARWLGDKGDYSPDDQRRPLVADLLLGVGLLERASGATARLCADGVVDFVSQTGVESRVLAISGLGTARWSAMEARIPAVVAQLKTERSPRSVLVSGVVGSPRVVVAPPPDLVMGDTSKSILDPHDEPERVLVDELRADPSLSTRMVA